MTHVELVQVRTADGVRLDGALAMPRHLDPQRKASVDAVLAIHGTGSNFYSSTVFEGLTPKLLADGMAVLRANTRGHDVLSMAATLQGSRRQGSALERVGDCCHDLVAWVEMLTSRGCKSIALVGHSLGAIKAIYTTVCATLPAVTRQIAISPPRLSHSYFLKSERHQDFLTHYQAAKDYVATGKGETLISINTPGPFLVSADSFLDKYGPQESYNFLRYIDRIQLPTLFAYGTVELAEVSFRELPEAIMAAASPAQNVRVVTVTGANHSYTGQIDELAYKIRSWLGAT